ncbi:MAG: hypothetical protein IT360_19305 [Gemmatimonadaceae bacterium]|nr:hypothetical protein [Gemmatimonadaceae bacterium]
MPERPCLGGRRMQRRAVATVFVVLGVAWGGATASAQDSDARIARLKRSFDCTDVPSASAFVCSLKDGMVGSAVRKRIEPVVTSTGTIFLRSVYRDRDWIYHDHVEIRIGDEVLRTATVLPTSPNMSRRDVQRTGSNVNRRRNGRNQRDDFVDERVSYRGADEGAIVKAIAEAGAAPVNMQLAGGPRTFEKTLSDDEKRLFAEAYELAGLLRARAATRE